MDLSLLVEDSLNIQGYDFIKTVDSAVSLLRKEKGRLGNFSVTNRLVELQPTGEALVVGDLHGDLTSLTTILQKSAFIEKMEKTKETTLIFLGDYGDRGERSAEVYYVILRLKLAFPLQVVLLRGNHEGTRDLMAYPHDLPIQFQRRFGEGGRMAYERMHLLFACLYNALYVKERYLMVHGGISPQISSLQDIAQAQENQNEALLEDLLWSDPDESEWGMSSSPRGAGKLFGRRVTEDVLRELNAKILIRGHESASDGFRINHEGKVLTLFSRKGSPYFNRFGAYLQLPLSEEIDDATRLMSWIHKF